MNLRIITRNIFRPIVKFLGRSIPMGDVWSWLLPNSWTTGDLIEQYKRLVFPIITRIAENSAKIEFKMEKMVGDKTIKVDNHPFLELIKRPNPNQSQFQFLEFHFTYMELIGESFWYLVRRKQSREVVAIYNIRPDIMDVVIDKTSPYGLVGGYVLNKPNGEKVPFELDEILHFKYPNPNDPYRGLGAVQAGRIYIQTEEYASDWTKNSIYNSGRPSGVLNIKGVIDDKEFSRIKKLFKQEYAGRDNAGKTMLLNGTDGIDYQKLGMELGEVSLKELKAMVRDDILFMFGMSKTMMGIQEDVNRSNAREAKEVFLENIIKPKVDRFIDHLNAFLIPDMSKGDEAVKLGYEDMLEESMQEKIERWKAGHNKWLTTNKILAEQGEDPVEGGDKLYRSRNEVAIDQIEPTKEDKPVVPPVEVPKEDKKSAPTIIINNISEPHDHDKHKKKLTSKEKAQVKQDKTDEENFNKLIANQDVWKEKVQELLVKEFNRQLKDILKKHPTKDVQVRVSKARMKATMTEWLFDNEVSIQRIVKVLTSMGLNVFESAGQLGLEISQAGQQVVEIDEASAEYIRDRIQRMAEKTNDETIRQIEDSLGIGLLERETVAQLRKRVEDVYNDAIGYRAERIARTETTAISNFGVQESYKMNPLVRGKRWYSEPDACEFCQPFSGTIIGLNEDFASIGTTVPGVQGGSFNVDYTDVGFPPLHALCRCAILPVLE